VSDAVEQAQPEEETPADKEEVKPQA
jgi:ribonuclease E